MAEIWGIAAVAGAAIVGGVISAQGAKSAASTQAKAAQNAQNISQNEFNTIVGQEQPYMQAGYGAQSQLNYLLGTGKPGTAASATTPGTASRSLAGGYGSLTQPFTAQYMKQYSPAYQFQLQQGQQGVLNANAPGQGSLSGASLKDLMSFNQGYANTAYNNAFNQYQAQQQNTFSRLYDVASLGQAAASNLGQQGTALAGQQAQSATNIGTALGAGQIGVANALSGGIGSATLLAALYGNRGQAGGFSPDLVNAQAGHIGYGGGSDLGSGLGYVTPSSYGTLG